eukprot:CAMPEP_0116042960 /NCGR_PEP_ID=MMETSP0321-20121206/26039_1 /TAXON_ID=163516 /ORGANISM="Leptocylindrus danicus var. danicus, Strain B650" /LENGTH=583 /DNA_ID=CAMNT_0003523613 /DNA_START=100 /DNA_END=1851 /DNA_ORIENTATION=+
MASSDSTAKTGTTTPSSNANSMFTNYPKDNAHNSTNTTTTSNSNSAAAMCSILNAEERTRQDSLLALEALLDINKRTTTTTSSTSNTTAPTTLLIPNHHHHTASYFAASSSRGSSTMSTPCAILPLPPPLMSNATANATFATKLSSSSQQQQQQEQQKSPAIVELQRLVDGGSSTRTTVISSTSPSSFVPYSTTMTPALSSSSSLSYSNNHHQNANNKSDGRKKKNKKSSHEANIRKEEVEAALRSKPQRGRKRENLSEQERLELTRTRNREHAKTTRNRKKARYDELVQIEQQHESCKRQIETMKARRAHVDDFLRIRSAHLMCFSVAPASTSSSSGPASNALWSMNMNCSSTTTSVPAAAPTDRTLREPIRVVADVNRKNCGLDDKARSVSFTTDDGVPSSANGTPASSFAVDSAPFEALLDDSQSFQFHLCCESELLMGSNVDGEIKVLHSTDLAGMCSFDAVIRDNFINSSNDGRYMSSRLEYVVAGSAPEGEIATTSDTAFAQVDLVANTSAGKESAVLVASGIMKFLFSTDSGNIVAIDSFMHKNRKMMAKAVDDEGASSGRSVQDEDEDNGPGMNI